MGGKVVTSFRYKGKLKDSRYLKTYHIHYRVANSKSRRTLPVMAYRLRPEFPPPDLSKHPEEGLSVGFVRRIKKRRKIFMKGYCDNPSCKSSCKGECKWYVKGGNNKSRLGDLRSTGRRLAERLLRYEERFND